MASPVAGSTISNVAMGAALLTWGGVSLGHTLGGATFTFERELTQLEVDKYGKTAVDMALTGQNLQIEVNLAEPVVDFIANAVPESPNLGTIVGGTLKKKLGLGVDAGASLRALAKPLVLHPSDRPASDLTQDVLIYLAVSVDNVELNYEVDSQRVFKVTFKALVDEGRGNGFRLGQIGQDPIS